MSYQSALNKINTVKNEVNDGMNTADRVGDAMKESLDYAKGKPDTVDISQYLSEGAELPLGCYYIYYGNPTHTLAGRYTYTDTYFIAVCISHWEHAHTLAIYTKNSQNQYIYYETFRTDQASTAFEKYVAELFAAPPVTYEQDGLMRATDKQLFDDVVTEVFPVEVAIASSNAAVREIGSSVVPSITLDITRKGTDVADSAEVVFTPADGSLSQDHKTYTGAPIASGSKTYQIAVTQGGQTVSAPSQTFRFLDYRYLGEVSTKPANANAVKTLCENGTIGKELSSATTKSKTALAANKYYVFVVPTTSVNLIVKNANSGGTVEAAGSGTFTINRVNNTGTVDCKYIIVPASSNSWNFEIVNS